MNLHTAVSSVLEATRTGSNDRLPNRQHHRVVPRQLSIDARKGVWHGTFMVSPAEPEVGARVPPMPTLALGASAPKPKGQRTESN